jgi:hypothetical protein
MGTHTYIAAERQLGRVQAHGSRKIRNFRDDAHPARGVHVYHEREEAMKTQTATPSFITRLVPPAALTVGLLIAGPAWFAAPAAAAATCGTNGVAGPSGSSTICT